MAAVGEPSSVPHVLPKGPGVALSCPKALLKRSRAQKHYSNAFVVERNENTTKSHLKTRTPVKPEKEGQTRTTANDRAQPTRGLRPSGMGVRSCIEKVKRKMDIFTVAALSKRSKRLLNLGKHAS